MVETHFLPPQAETAIGATRLPSARLGHTSMSSSTDTPARQGPERRPERTEPRRLGERTDRSTDAPVGTGTDTGTSARWGLGDGAVGFAEMPVGGGWWRWEGRGGRWG